MKARTFVGTGILMLIASAITCSVMRNYEASSALGASALMAVFLTIDVWEDDK